MLIIRTSQGEPEQFPAFFVIEQATQQDPGSLTSRKLRYASIVQSTFMPPEPILTTLTLFPNVYAYYAGRTGKRFHSPSPNWLDDGAYVLGVASYALVSGSNGLVFDAHITSLHANAVLEHLRSIGVMEITLVYSHAHRDHIAGASSFRDSANPKTVEIIASEDTKNRIQKGMESFAKDDPPFEGVLPIRTFSSSLKLCVGKVDVELRAFDIHTSDSIVLWVPTLKLLLAGDTLEDTCTYMAEPAHSATHIHELDRMGREFAGARILPAHGSIEKIKEVGYTADFVLATSRYIEAMTNIEVDEPVPWSSRLTEIDCVGDWLENGTLEYWSEYETVHKENIEALRRLRQESKSL